MKRRTDTEQRQWEREQARRTKEHGGDPDACRKHVERERLAQTRLGERRAG